MIFAWDEQNREHIAKHGVSPEEAEEVVQAAKTPFPRAMRDEKFMVWGQTSNGRYLQVIFVFKQPQEISYAEISLQQWADVEAKGIKKITRVIHAMDLPEPKKRILRRQRKRT